MKKYQKNVKNILFFILLIFMPNHLVVNFIELDLCICIHIL